MHMELHISNMSLELTTAPTPVRLKEVLLRSKERVCQERNYCTPH